MKWAYLVGAIVTEVTATLSLKEALTHPWLYVVVTVGYLAAFWCLAMTLRQGMGLGVAYGIWGAVGVALTALLSAALFHESLTWLMGLGMVLVIGGVLLVELGAERAAKQSNPKETA